MHARAQTLTNMLPHVHTKKDTSPAYIKAGTNERQTNATRQGMRPTQLLSITQAGKDVLIIGGGLAQTTMEAPSPSREDSVKYV